MTTLPFAGLLTWIGAGLLAGFFARLFPRRDLAPLVRELGVSIAGGIVGGLLATVLGFGGLAAADWRAGVVAGLAGLLAVLLLRLVRQ